MFCNHFLRKTKYKTTLKKNIEAMIAVLGASDDVGMHGLMLVGKCFYNPPVLLGS